MKRFPHMRIGSGLVLGAIALVSLSAPWLAPGGPDLQEDVAGARHLAPLTAAHAIRVGPHRTWIVTSLHRTDDGWEFLRGGQPMTISEAETAGPPSSRFYTLGTDGLGRDLTARILYGARHSLGIASLCVALALVAGVGVGAAAGLAGGWWDASLMRGVDALLCIPRLVVFFVCAAALPPSTPLLVLVMVATTWTGLARLVRGEIQSLRQTDMVAAARAMGCSRLRLLVVHLVPAMGPLITVSLAVRFSDTILLESALSFLGLGSPPPAVSLGEIIASGRELADAWWVVLWPGLLIGLIVISLRATAAGLLRTPEPPSVA